MASLKSWTYVHRVWHRRHSQRRKTWQDGMDIDGKFPNAPSSFPRHFKHLV